MCRWAFVSFPVALVVLMVCSSLAPALANDEVEAGKVYRIVRTDGKEFTGEVAEYPNVYKLTVSTGIVLTIKKSQVREITLVENGDSPEEEGTLRRHITDAEIEEILGSESVEDMYVWDYVEQVDLLEELPTDPESLETMLRYAKTSTIKAKVLETPHFLVVYTSDTPSARNLVARLETVYRWNVAFTRMYGVPVVKPDHKFEVFHFGTYDEFVSYATLCGHMAEGAAGFYMRDSNRCAFFEQSTYPPVARLLKALREGDVPYQERRRLENGIERWANFFNLEVTQHEATHAIHFNIGVFPKGARTGKWMTEGLCVQFEVPPTQEGGSFGSINYTRLDQFHKMYMNGDKVVVPWQFVKNMILAPGTGMNDYVMGWAFNYYLRKQFKEKYAKWMQLLAAREDDWSVEIDTSTQLSDYEGVFGRLDEAFVQEFYDYIAKIPVKQSAIVEFPAP